MLTKEMTLCKVKLVWKREEVKNGQGKTIFGPTAEYEGFYAVESVLDERPFTKQRWRAAQLALEDVVGPPEYQEKVGAKVVSVKVLGLVRVEE